MAETLDGKGFEVKTASSGAEALEILEVYPVDVLLTDVRMPDMDGLELYRESRKINPDLTTILMTAYAADDLIEQGAKEGITAVLDKPVDIKFLLAVFSTIKGLKSSKN